jgi:hypothetical protein
MGRGRREMFVRLLSFFIRDVCKSQEQTAYQAAVAINVLVRDAVYVGVQLPMIMRKGGPPE